MAKSKSTTPTRAWAPKDHIKRKGRHSKKRSATPGTKTYEKPYNGQGR